MKRIFIALFLLMASAAFASNEISSFTEGKIKEFLTTRIELRSGTKTSAVSKIAEVREQTFSALAGEAVDFEQEKLILESFYFMEEYEWLLDPKTNRAELRKQMRNLMKQIFACIDSRGEAGASKWLYNVGGDVTSYYMTRSIKATLFYGLRVKEFYEKAIEKDANMTTSNVCLGNWYFYAPKVCGGGRDKAEKCFQKALLGSSAKGEYYIAYQSLSQLYFEEKRQGLFEKCTSALTNLGIGKKEIALMKKCNDAGYSFFQYRRNRAGIDEKLEASEKEEED